MSETYARHVEKRIKELHERNKKIYVWNNKIKKRERSFLKKLREELLTSWEIVSY